MNTLQQLLIILGGQKLGAGYLVPQATALETAIALMNGFNMWVRYSNPLPMHTHLLRPAWIGSLAAGQDAIFLAGLDGSLDLANNPKPAYILIP